MSAVTIGLGGTICNCSKPNPRSTSGMHAKCQKCEKLIPVDKLKDLMAKQSAPA